MASPSPFGLSSKYYNTLRLLPHIIHSTQYNEARTSLEPVNINMSTILTTYGKSPSAKDTLGT